MPSTSNRGRDTLTGLDIPTGMLTTDMLYAVRYATTSTPEHLTIPSDPSGAYYNPPADFSSGEVTFVTNPSTFKAEGMEELQKEVALLRSAVQELINRIDGTGLF